MRSTYSAARNRRGGTALVRRWTSPAVDFLITRTPAHTERVPATRRACVPTRGVEVLQLPGRPNIRRLLELQA